MGDRENRLKSVAELYSSGVLTQQEYEIEKAKILNEPSQQYNSGFYIGRGQIPHYRRSGWSWWGAYIAVLIFGTILSTYFHTLAYENEDCYEDYYYYYCEPDMGLLLLSTLVDLLSTLTYFIIYITWTYKMYSEFNNYMGQMIFNPFLAACIPFFNLYAFYNYCDHLNRQADARGQRNFIEPGVTCCLVFIIGIGLPIFQSRLNEFWDIVQHQNMPPSASQPPVQPPSVEWQ